MNYDCGQGKLIQSRGGECRVLSTEQQINARIYALLICSLLLHYLCFTKGQSDETMMMQQQHGWAGGTGWRRKECHVRAEASLITLQNLFLPTCELSYILYTSDVSLVDTGTCVTRPS